MTQFQINKHYRATSTESHWILEKYEGFDKKKGEQIWKPRGYFMTLQNLLSYSLDTLIKDSGATSIKEIQKSIENALGTLREGLK